MHVGRAVGEDEWEGSEAAVPSGEAVQVQGAAQPGEAVQAAAGRAGETGGGETGGQQQEGGCGSHAGWVWQWRGGAAVQTHILGQPGTCAAFVTWRERP